MKKGIYILYAILVALVSCKDDDIDAFDETADERVAQAIATLKEDLTDPANGWIVKYRPEDGSGSYYVLLDFDEDGKVTIKSDLGRKDGEFFEQTITYRIDSSLGLELILENYCFFSYLFEQNAATFLAEFEFNYVNKTPDDELVFSSKSDPGTPTILLFEEASASDVNLLGVALAQNLNVLAEDLDNFTPSFKLTYDNKDLLFYLSLDDFQRVISFTAVAKKTATQNTQVVNFSTPYIIKGDSISFDEPLIVSAFGNNVTIKGIKFSTLANSSLNVCAAPIPTHIYSGVTSASDPVKLEPSLVDGNGKSFAQLTDFYVCALTNIFQDGERATEQVQEDITGAQSMQLYYNYNLNGTPFYAVGFYIQNANGTVTFALRQFTPTLTNNNIVFNFAPDISIFGSQQTDADINNINIYLQALSDGGDTYVFQYSEGLYEFYNPCTGWTFAFEAVL